MNPRPSTLAIDFGGTLSTGDVEDPEADSLVDADAAATLHELRGAGYRLVLSTNTLPDRSRRPALAAAGVLDLFVALVESHELGWAKPAPEFYAAVIEAAACPPNQIVHIGNRLAEDVLMPLSMGMTAVLVQPYRRSRARLPGNTIHVLRFADLSKLLLAGRHEA